MKYEVCYVVIVWILSSVLPGHSFYYGFSMQNLCSGKLSQNNRATPVLDECPVPFFYGAGRANYMTRQNKVTEPATVQDIKISWFLDQGNPALNISFKALSPDSPQIYEINVLADTYPTAIYCGQVHTAKPNSEHVVQNLGVEVRCPGDKLKPSMGLNVAIEPSGSAPTYPRTERYDLPGCNNRAMQWSNECKERKRKRIVFSLHQDGNATVVVLVTKTAYAKQITGEKVYLSIRQRKIGALDGWKSLGKPLELYWPQRAARFEDLTPGETYSVVAWRTGDIIRSSRVITIKSDYKMKRVNRLSKRLARLRS